MRLTVNQMMQQIASTVNQDSDVPDAGSSENQLWLQYLNRAYEEWSESFDWEELREDYYPTISANSTATVTMPSNFRKLAGYPLVSTGETSWYTQKEIPAERITDQAANERYVTVRGNQSDGMSVTFSPATLASGASVMIPYFKMPESLASTGEYSIVPDPYYLVERTIAYILEARSDPRFQIQEGKARERLMRMVENANAAKYNSFGGEAPMLTNEQRMGFRFGRD